MSLRALFLDRDGVINTRKVADYVRDYSEFYFCEGVLDGLARITSRKLFDIIVVVTNQMGVAKGLMTAAQLDEIHKQMCADIQQSGGRIDAVFAAIGGKDDPRRKPNPTMGLEAQESFGSIDFGKSVMVGDTASDLDFGKQLGMRLALIETPIENVNLITQLHPQAELHPSFFHWVNKLMKA